MAWAADWWGAGVAIACTCMRIVRLCRCGRRPDSDSHAHGATSDDTGESPQVSALRPTPDPAPRSPLS